MPPPGPSGPPAGPERPPSGGGYWPPAPTADFDPTNPHCYEVSMEGGKCSSVEPASIEFSCCNPGKIAEAWKTVHDGYRAYRESCGRKYGRGIPPENSVCWQMGVQWMSWCFKCMHLGDGSGQGGPTDGVFYCTDLCKHLATNGEPDPCEIAMLMKPQKALACIGACIGKCVLWKGSREGLSQKQTDDLEHSLELCCLKASGHLV